MNTTLLAATVFVAVLFTFLGLRYMKLRDQSWRARVDPIRFGAVNLPNRPAEHEEEPERGGPLGRLEAEARRAGLQVTGPQLLGVILLAGVVAAGVAYTLVPRPGVAAVATLAGLMAPRIWIARARQRRAEAFAQALDGALGIMSSSLRAGVSLAQAIARAAEQAEEPVRTELQRAARAISLGATAAEALASVSKRVASPDWELVVVATNILTRTGGNLAEVFDQIAATIRARRLARKAIQAQTAQIRLTATLVAVIPAFVTLAIRLLNPGYFTPMLSSPAGVVVFAGAFGVIFLGWLWIRNMANVVPE